MAGEKEGGARLGQIPSNLTDVNNLLGDITTKLGNLSNFPGLEPNVKPWDDIANYTERISRVNERWGKTLGARAKIEKDLSEQLKKKVKQNTRLKDDEKALHTLAQKQGGLYKSEWERLRLIESEIADTGEEVEGILASQKKVEGKWTTIFKLVGQDLLGALDKVAKSIISLTIDFLIVGFQKVYDLVDRTVRATGQFRESLGATTAGMADLEKEGWKLEGALRGLSNAELGIGPKEFAEATKAFGFADKKLFEFTRTAVVAGKAFGIGSQAAGGLARTFKQLGFEGKESAGLFMDISDAANAAGVPVSEFANEVKQSSNFMAQFGRQGKKTFLDTAAFAKYLGMSIQSMAGFTDLTDTFEGAAGAASKMNAVFGTSISGLELMLEDDPSKRLEMVRKSLVNQGRTFESMSRQERKFLAQSIGIREEELAGVIQSKKTLANFQKDKEKAARKEIDDQKALQKAMLRTAQTINNWGATWDSVTREIKGIFDDLLGADFFQRLPGMIKEWTTEIREFIKTFRASKDGKKYIQDIKTAATGLLDVIKKIAPYVFDIFGFMVRNASTILGIWAIFKVGGAIWTGANAFLALMGTGSTVGGALLGFGKSLAGAGASFVGSAGSMATAMTGISGPLGLGAFALSLAAAGAAGYWFGTKLREWLPIIDTKVQSFMDEQAMTLNKLTAVFSKESRDRQVKEGEAELNYALAKAGVKTRVGVQGGASADLEERALKAGEKFLNAALEKAGTTARIGEEGRARAEEDELPPLPKAKAKAVVPKPAAAQVTTTSPTPLVKPGGIDYAEKKTKAGESTIIINNVFQVDGQPLVRQQTRTSLTK